MSDTRTVKSLRRWTAAHLIVSLLLIAQYPTVASPANRLLNAALIAWNLWSACSNALTIHVAVVEWALTRRGFHGSNSDA